MLRRRMVCSSTLLIGCTCAVLVGGIFLGCHEQKKHKDVVIQSRYTTLPAKKVPPFLKDTLLERCDLVNTEPFLVSGYSVVVNLNGTGDGTAPNMVRQYIVNEMVKHKWGSSLSGIHMPSPEAALRDPRVAIVQVDGYLPPGVRRGQRFDVQVSALSESNTTSLASGDLFETDLRIRGANPADPGGAVNLFASAHGPIFVNPAYALNPNASEDAAARRSLRMGVVMNGAGAIEDRPIGLRIRQPSMRLSRYIEDRIDARFQEVRPDTIAAAQDEGIVYIYVPRNFDGDWEHFVGVVTHLYLNNSPEFSAAKAKDLADEATKPDAPLLDISYAWEAIGKPALAVIQERGFMSSENPDLAYAAARAAAFLGDPSAPQALIKIARTNGHRFQINAIQVLGALPSSPAINETLRPLLDSPENLVRIEAYKMLAKNNDNSIFSTEIRGGFKLDIVKSSAAPVLYATRRGEPRVAVIGDRAKLMMPITFTTLDKHLSISSDPTNHSVTIYYRPVAPPTGIQSRETLNQMNPIRVKSGPDIAEVIARLGGEGDDTGRGLRFNYGQIVAILNNLTDQQQVSAVANGGGKQPASFILQELPQAADSIYAAPVIPDQGRPQGEDEPGKVGMAK